MTPRKFLPLVAVALLSASQAHADGLAISITDVTTGATTVVTGTVSTPELGEQSVLSDFAEVTRFNPSDEEAWPAEVAQTAGIDLVDAFIAPIDNGLRFTWQMSALPGTIIPEGVRYNWSFTVGGEAYQLQAKSSNLASITTAEAPQEHVEQAASGQNFFQIRGNCEAQYRGTPISGCYHLAFLDGGVDAGTGRVWIDLPYGDARWSDIVEGVEITEALNAGMSIAANFQAVVSTADISQYINGWKAYTTTPTIKLAVETSTEFPDTANYRFDVERVGDDWTAEIPAIGSKFVIARACHGAVCVYDDNA